MKTTFTNREISWLAFNNRVLQEADSEEVPLYERIRFLGIFSNNLDEFYRVRVATLTRLYKLKEKDFPEKAIIYKDLLDEINDINAHNQNEVSRILQNIQDRLEEKNVFLISEKELSPEQGSFIRQFFKSYVRPNLFPVILKNMQHPSFLKDSSIYLAIILKRHGFAEKTTYAVVEIPVKEVDRFIVLPQAGNKHYIIRLDDVIRYCLNDIFGVFGFDQFQAFTFKLTRDAELDIDEDISKSFVELISNSLKARETGNPVRFIYDKEMPSSLLNALMKALKIRKRDTVMQGGRYHNTKDFMNFPHVSEKVLSYEPIVPLPNKFIQPGKKITSSIRERDILLHYPYQPYQYMIDLLREASIDPKVRAIKMTLYRLANPSKVVNALVNASANGKQVTVFMEFQARFDESNNIYYSSKLQEAGVRIIKTIPGFKVHCKMILIKRIEGDKEKLYANISTGNFNEATSRIYSDNTLLTCDPRITSDVEKVFELFERSYKPMRFQHLVISPFSTRNFFLSLINNEIKNAKAGKPAWAIIKLNSLADEQLSRKLLQAAEAGVALSLIIRGICILNPEGHKNIEIISIVDKFLEHSRVLVFCNGGKNKYFISSADWMIRNLDNRIEVTTPIYNPDIQQELLDMLKIQLSDNTKARIIDNTLRSKMKINDQPKVRSQIDMYNYLKKKHLS
ncbi:MAG TPA: polyphosphate kinase 1 [Bacteroidales bacterium]|nr:polyphosphate kinase 1 [Bacteroidales bacterium]